MSASDHGTKCQIKNTFTFRLDKADISDNFLHAWELMSLIVESFVCMLAAELCHLNVYGARPSFARSNIENTEDAEKSIIWHALDTNQLTKDDSGTLPIICCGQKR